MYNLRLVVDTNVLINRLLSPRSLAARAVDLAIGKGGLLVSEATLSELARVLARPKFDRYADIEDRQEYIRYLSTLVKVITILQRFQACRYPKDDMFLDVAVNGQADAIITGDADLLALDPIHENSNLYTGNVGKPPLLRWSRELEIKPLKLIGGKSDEEPKIANSSVFGRMMPVDKQALCFVQ